MSTKTRTRLSQADRRKQLLGAARNEFYARGYSGARVQTVAQACGVTEALVYKHFESKEELFEAAVMEPLHELLAQRIEDIRSMPVDPQAEVQLETTQAFMRTLLSTFSESVEAIGVVLFGNREHATAFYAKHVRPLIDAAVEASEATMATWPHRDYDLRIAMNAVFGMAFWLALDSTLGKPNDDIEGTADQLTDILFNGIRAR